MGTRFLCWGLLVPLLMGCPLPEDQFVLSGKVDPRVEVRLFRNQVASETRCDSLEPLATARADDWGHYEFPLIRQEITRGVAQRRFFRVEVDQGPAVLSQSFWFPDADLDLGELSASGSPAAWRIAEAELDGHVAWRSERSWLIENDRPFRWRQATALREWRTVPVDSLGRYDIIPVEWRLEGAWEAGAARLVTAPLSRGAECPFLDLTPCPLTDGRYVPYVFAPDTRELVFNFHHEVQLSPLLFHGLALARPAAKVRFDFNFVEDFSNWSRLGSTTVDLRLQELSVDRCNEPGVFLSVAPGGFIKPVALRVVFEDEASNAIPIVSLAEISTR